MEILLLTASIQPRLDVIESENSLQIRSSQYAKAIERWNRYCHENKLVLGIAATMDREDEFWSAIGGKIPDVLFSTYEPTPKERKQGKGAVEMRAVNQFITNWDIDSTSTIHKVTGRLWIPNAKNVLFPVRESQVRAVRRYDGQHIDTRLVSGNTAFWTTTAQAAADLVDDDNGVYIEHALGGYLSFLSSTKQIQVSSYSQFPKFEGISGSTGIKYNSIKHGIKLSVYESIGNLCKPILGRIHY